MTTTTKTAAVKTTKTTITKAELKRLKACLHLRSLIAMTTTTKTAAVKTTKTTITKAELKKIKAQGVLASPFFDRYDDDHQDRCREDHEDDDHQGGVEKDQGGEEDGGQDCQECIRQEKCPGHEEGREGHFRQEGP